MSAAAAATATTPTPVIAIRTARRWGWCSSYVASTTLSYDDSVVDSNGGWGVPLCDSDRNGLLAVGIGSLGDTACGLTFRIGGDSDEFSGSRCGRIVNGG